MGKPYSDLEKRAIAILAGGGNPATSQDEAVRKYWQWKINPSSSAHDLPETSTRTTGRKKDEVLLLPFGVTLSTGLFAKAMISKRSNTALPSGVKTACAYKTLDTGNQALKLANFRPAQVYWRTGEGTTSAERISRITGRKYKSYYTAADEGFVAPFGRNNTSDVEGARQTVIKAAFSGINLITFTPEKYRG